MSGETLVLLLNAYALLEVLICREWVLKYKNNSSWGTHRQTKEAVKWTSLPEGESLVYCISFCEAHRKAKAERKLRQSVVYSHCNSGIWEATWAIDTGQFEK